MLNEHTLDQLSSLRLDGMVRAVEEQATSTAADALGFDERLTLLVQREIAWRDDGEWLGCSRRPSSRSAQPASRTSTGAPVARWTAASSPRWPAATGCASAQPADHRRHRQRQDMVGMRAGASGGAQGLLGAVRARGPAVRGVAGRPRRWQLRPAAAAGQARSAGDRRFCDLSDRRGERNDLLELLDDRIGSRSTLITSQLPVKAWHT